MAENQRLDDEALLRLGARFAARIMRASGLPSIREADLRESCEISRTADGLRLTCTITGSTYDRPGDGSESEAAALVDDAADSTVFLITKTSRYAWMWSRR
jgi:hypothetical protein